MECADCGSLFVSPRPPAAEFDRFYASSRSAKYWAEVFLPAVLEKRREAIFRPRVERIRALTEELDIAPDTIVDVGAGHGLFLEEWKASEPPARLVALEPNDILAEVCRSKGMDVVCDTAEGAIEELSGAAELVTCFEVIEHVRDPLRFISSLRAFIRPGGAVIVTGLNCEGFDIQVLWERSNAVAPPHHINFCTIEGYRRLFLRAGFKEVRVETPGRLDVDIVRNTLDPSDQGNGLSRFERTLLARSRKDQEAFQAFLSENRLSSHTWVVAR